MNLFKIGFFILFIFLQSMPGQSAIYGEDNRKEIYEISDELQELARSTVVFIKSWQFYEKEDSLIFKNQLFKETLGEQKKLKKGEAFFEQPAHGFCSGVLISSHQVLTAHHCVYDSKGLSTTLIAFDYFVSENSQTSLVHKKQNVFQIKEIKKLGIGRDPIALIELDREVLDRSPVAYKINGAGAGQEIFTIHYPSGLPAKYSSDAQIRAVGLGEEADSFSSNLDTFHGSSGAPIFDAQTFELIGLLFAGEKDYGKKLFFQKKKVKVYESTDDEFSEWGKILSLTWEN